MIRVENLGKSFKTKEGGVDALAGISFEVKQGSFFTLLGPSGCGKTTTLRSVAGLERPDQGEITIGERKVFSSRDKIFIPGNKRDVGMVFQSYAIWPHMTVFNNIAYPLKAKRRPREEIQQRVHKALQLVGLGELGDRLAPRLSGSPSATGGKRRPRPPRRLPGATPFPRGGPIPPRASSDARFDQEACCVPSCREPSPRASTRSGSASRAPTPPSCPTPGGGRLRGWPDARMVRALLSARSASRRAVPR